MKRSKQRPALIFLALLVPALYGCDSNGGADEDVACTASIGGTVTARVEGRSFCSRIVLGGLMSPQTNSFLLVSGASDTEEALSITIEQEIRVGTYTTSSEGVSAGYADPSEKGYSAFGRYGSGTITITERTATSIKGTFEFTAVALTSNLEPTGEQVRVTNGRFEVPLSE